MEELPPRRLLQLAPQRVGALYQRHVGRMLEIGEPDDARCAMRGTAVVAGREPFDAQDALAAACKPMERGAAHHAKPDHDDVEMAHAVSACSGKAGTGFRTRPCAKSRWLALPVVRVPVPLEIGDEGGAEAAIGLIACIGGGVAAKEVERLLHDPERAPVANGADRSGIGEAVDRALDGGVHVVARGDLVADEAAVEAVADKLALVGDLLPCDAIAGERRET